MQTHQIERLGKGDFADLIQHLNLAFEFTDGKTFENLLPGWYQPTDTSAGYNHAIRNDTGYLAVVGVFPIHLRTGKHTLKIAGVGGVSVHPDARGQGLMSQMMKHVTQRIAADGYPLAWLSGQRQRYQTFGWEMAGCEYHCKFFARNLLGRDDWRVADLTLEPLQQQPDVTTVAQLQALHDAQPCCATRDPEQFVNFLRQWEHCPFVAREANGTVVGYCVTAGHGRSIVEVVARDLPTTKRMLAAAIERAENPITVRVSPARPSLVRCLAEVCENISVHNVGSWLVCDWPTTLTALLELARKTRPLASGELVIEIADERLWLRVDEDGAVCEAAGHGAPAPALCVDSLTAMRLLFGPAQPSHVHPLDAQSAILESWCPLPMHLPRQDHC